MDWQWRKEHTNYDFLREGLYLSWISCGYNGSLSLCISLFSWQSKSSVFSYLLFSNIINLNIRTTTKLTYCPHSCLLQNHMSFIYSPACYPLTCLLYTHLYTSRPPVIHTLVSDISTFLSVRYLVVCCRLSLPGTDLTLLSPSHIHHPRTHLPLPDILVCYTCMLLIHPAFCLQ